MAEGLENSDRLWDLLTSRLDAIDARGAAQDVKLDDIQRVLSQKNELCGMHAAKLEEHGRALRWLYTIVGTALAAVVADLVLRR